MRFSVKISITALLLLIVNPINSSIVDTKAEIICNPTNPTECYPKVFEPSSVWQTIREGQEIPPGLHVRLNLESGEREAKIMEVEEANSSELIVGEQPEEQKIEFTDEQTEQIKKKIQEFNKGKNKPKPKVSVEELKNFQNSVDELSSFDGDRERLIFALENLIDLSHDIDFGASLTSGEAFGALEGTLSKHLGDDIDEKVYRLMGSALRNNPEAIKNVLNEQPVGFVEDLFIQLKATNSDVIQKRILGVIQGLTQDNHFRMNFFNNDEEEYSFGINQLIQVYPKLGPQSKVRLINIFEDIKLTQSKSNDKRSIESSTNTDWNYSQMLQEILVDEKANSKDQFKLIFNKLVEIHENTSDLKVSSDFLQWLSKEVASLPTSIEERDSSSDEDQAFNKAMLHARHVVFGNPNALRKAYVGDL